MCSPHRQEHAAITHVLVNCALTDSRFQMKVGEIGEEEVNGPGLTGSG